MLAVRLRGRKWLRAADSFDKCSLLLDWSVSRRRPAGMVFMLSFLSCRERTGRSVSNSPAPAPTRSSDTRPLNTPRHLRKPDENGDACAEAGGVDRPHRRAAVVVAAPRSMAGLLDDETAAVSERDNGAQNDDPQRVAQPFRAARLAG